MKKCWDLMKKWLKFLVVYCLKFQWICNRFTHFLGVFLHVFWGFFHTFFHWFLHIFFVDFFMHFHSFFSHIFHSFFHRKFYWNFTKFKYLTYSPPIVPITIAIPILTLIVPHIPVWPGPSSVPLTHTPEQSWPKVESHCQLSSRNTTLVGVDHTITTICPGRVIESVGDVKAEKTVQQKQKESRIHTVDCLHIHIKLGGCRPCPMTPKCGDKIAVDTSHTQQGFKSENVSER